MADLDPLGLFPNSRMAAAIRQGQSRFYSAEPTGPPVAPGNLTPPVISGSPIVGQTLSSSRGTWTGPPTGFTYQWKRGGVAIAGATSSTYLLVSADTGTNITVDVTATNTAGSDTATSASIGPVIVAPANTVLPVISSGSGYPSVGSTLSTTNGTWTGTAIITYTYQWLRSGSSIGGATSSTYLLVAVDDADMMTVVVTATNAAGSSSVTSAAVGPVWTPVSVGAIVLSLTSIANDNTPNYSLDLPSDIAVGDIVYLEVADNSGFTGSILDTTDIGPMSGDPITMTTVAVTDGVWYARTRIKRGTGYGPYSNVVTVTIDTTAPPITSPSTFSWPENSAFSTTLTASETVTWTKTGGADSALFTLTGAVLSMTAKDFELPVDADTNNAYIVQVTATDSATNATNQTITVTITDVPDTFRQFMIASVYVNAAGSRQYITAAGYLVE